ncbi:MAG TPA: RNA polymerase factor sigma-54 [Saprospiraceae bacterium]|nr:RNA polymerase factor sigma-54 [Saprospiraceae bacterium]HMP26100.1 RNA polymerase factor sigma-54 [Saprospiraceae bacterium]
MTMLRQSLSQKMTQKLSPQQIQLMKLLQVPTANLEQRIKEELEINPALEEGDREEFEPSEGTEDFDQDNTEPQDAFEMDEYWDSYIEDDPTSYKTRGDSYAAEEDKTIPVAVSSSFHDYLEEQLGMAELSDAQEMAIALQIIGSIDDDGYLRRAPLSIMDDLLFSQNIVADEAKILAVLQKIQRLDPPGVGARDLRECLLIQLENEAAQNHQAPIGEQFVTDLAIRIIRDYFDEFTKKHYEKLVKLLEVSEEELREAIDEILKLNPKPASGYTGDTSQSVNYVVPDFIIVNRDGELDLSLNMRNAPELRISDHYRDMLRDYARKARSQRTGRQEREAVTFIKQKIDSARWFIDAIRQRQETMYKTMYAILQYQYDYFFSGDERKLRPMILKDISEITGLDISTISRVANSKYVQTEFGVKRLKEFFSEGMQTQEGEEVSTLEVKKVLSDLIATEQKRKPLSDEKLTQLLSDKGYDIARRTVAKYREQLNIPVARLRKEL